MSRYRRGFLLGVVLAAACLALSAQRPSQARWPLRSIAIEGNKLYTDQQLVAATGLKLGEACNQAAFEAARDRLLATGALETVAFHFGPAATGDGYAVTFEVAEVQQVFPLQFVNLGVPEEEILAFLKQKDPLFTGKGPGTEQFLRRYSTYIEELLGAKGRKVDVRGELTADVPEAFYILFYPKGALPVIAEVDFQGNKVLPKERLQEAIHGAAVGARFTEGRMRALLDASVRPVYEMRGRLNVQFPKIETERAAGGVRGIRVVVTVDEGESFQFGRIHIRGPEAMADSLYSAAALKPGDVANMNEVSAAAARIRKALQNQGYMKAAVTYERRLHVPAHTADITFTAVPGARYRFGRLIVEGLDLHGEHEIRRIWGMKPGDVFDGGYPEFFLERIRELGVFDNLTKTDVRWTVHEETRTVDVTLVFNPPPVKPHVGAP